MRDPTHYEILQVPREATGPEIRTAYRALARRYHPDLQSGNEATLRAVIEAYAVLSSPERRDRYDRELAAGGATAPPPGSRTTPHTTPGGDMSERQRTPERQRTRDVGVMPQPITFSQLCILVLDGSGSMAEDSVGRISKAQAVSDAVREMLARFGDSSQRRNFSFAVVNFDERASVHTPVTPVVEINNGASYDPMRAHGGSTDIGAGLREARRIAEEFLRDAPEGLAPSVVIVVMSDGLDDDPERTLRVAEEIRKNPSITICTTYFSQVGAVEQKAQEHLRALASHPATGFTTVYDVETLRKFFIASASVGTNLVIR